MIKKLTFKEWFFQCEFRKDGYDCNQVSFANSAWKFCQAQEQKEYQLLEAEHSILLDQFSKVDLERIRFEKENESLKKKLEKAKEVIELIDYQFCASFGDADNIRGAINKARSYLKENEG